MGQFVVKTPVDHLMFSFFESYYNKRNLQEILNMVTPDIVGVGLAVEEVGTDFESFKTFVKKQMEDFPNPIPYVVYDYVVKQTTSTTYLCFAKLKVKIITEDWGKVTYDLRITSSVIYDGESYYISSIHVSEATNSLDAKLPSMAMFKESISDISLRNSLNHLISRIVPSGIITCKIKGRFPITFANMQFLQLIGYTSYEEFIEDCDNSFMNCIHPDDFERYVYNVNFAITSKKECECDYRLKIKNGSYLWVHDVARACNDDDGDVIMLSMIIDISEQVEKRLHLEKETALDALTGIYNRKGARNEIKKNTKDNEPWIFLVADLDNFKKVNDIYGHKQGDKVLCYIAGELNKYFGKYGTVCRLGGDEFSLFLTNYLNLDQVREMMDEVSMKYRELLDAECPLANSSLSIGGVYGEGLNDFETIYEEADRNLYKIKSNEKGCLKLTALDEIGFIS